MLMINSLCLLKDLPKFTFRRNSNKIHLMVKYPDWSKEDIAIIKQLGPKTTLKELALNFPDKTI